MRTSPSGPGSTTTRRGPRPTWRRWAGRPGRTASGRRTARSWQVKFSQLSGIAVSENEALQAQNLLKEIGIKVDIVDVPIAKFQDHLEQRRVRDHRVQLDRDPVPVPGHQPDLRQHARRATTPSCQMPEVDENAKNCSTTEIDEAARIKLANETAAIIWENVIPCRSTSGRRTERPRPSSPTTARSVSASRSGRTSATRSNPTAAVSGEHQPGSLTVGLHGCCYPVQPCPARADPSTNVDWFGIEIGVTAVELLTKRIAPTKSPGMP